MQATYDVAALSTRPSGLLLLSNQTWGIASPALLCAERCVHPPDAPQTGAGPTLSALRLAEPWG